MLRFGWGKRIKPRKFDYLPRFYDESKERIEAQIDKYGDGQKPNANALMKSRIQNGLRQKYYHASSTGSDQIKKSNLRLIYIILILCFLSYMLLKSDIFLKFFEYLDN